MTKSIDSKFKHRIDFPRLSLINILGTLFLFGLFINFQTLLMVYAKIQGGIPCIDSLIAVKQSMFDFPKMYGNLCGADGNVLALMAVMGICALLLFISKKERGNWY